jgi:hypothetical protein
MSPLRYRAPLLVLAVGAAACGLFESASSGYGLLMPEDGGTPGHDAGTSRGDGARVDAHAAASDASDAKRPMTDGGAGDSVQPAADARPDVQAVHDAGADRATPDASDAANDGDAGSRGFCPTYVPPLGYSYTCEDFDENPDASAIGFVAKIAGGAVVEEDTVFKSPPRALETTATAPLVDGGQTFAYYGLTFGLATTYLLAFDAKIDTLVGTNAWVGGMFSANSVSQLEFFALPTGTAGEYDFGVADNVAGVYNGHPIIIGPWSGWIHFELTLTASGPGYVDSLSINGQVVEANYAVSPSFAPGSGLAGEAGWTYANRPGTGQMYVDNVVIAWK